MDFFYGTDWLHREPPYAFKFDHLLLIFIPLIIGVVLAFLLRKKSLKTIKIVLISLWAFGLALVITYYTSIYIKCGIDPETTFSLEGMLPFHSCLMFFYIFPLAIFSKNRLIKTASMNFLVIVNMIMGFITLFVGCPPVGSSALSFVGLQSMLYHGIIVVVPFIMLVTKYYDIQIKDLKYGLVLFCALSLIMWTFDAFTGCDYFYFYDGHTFPVLKFISENVHHLVWTLIVFSCYVITGAITHFLVIGVKYLVNRNKQAK